MSPSQDRSLPSARTAHGSWLVHVGPHDALADPLPFGMQDTSPRPVGCSGLASTSTSTGAAPMVRSQAAPRFRREELMDSTGSRKFGEVTITRAVMFESDGWRIAPVEESPDGEEGR